MTDPDDAAAIYVFASYAGEPRHLAWYYNLTSIPVLALRRAS